MVEIRIEDMNGFHFGHADDHEALTGCTVILCEKGAVGGVDVRGGAPGTRETDLLASENTVDTVHGVFLSGGSAFGLEVGSGVMTFLEERNVGVDVHVAKVPIVPGAILFDLYPGDPSVRPGKEMGIQACRYAIHNEPFEQGSVGAGMGTTVGKVLGPEYVMRGGLGSYAIRIGQLEVGAVIAVNAFGDIVDPDTGSVLAGAYDRETQTFISTHDQLKRNILDGNSQPFSGNTTIGTIVTNAALTKAQANKIASVGHNGFAKVIHPAHTPVDGDTLFALSTNKVDVDLNALAAVVVEVVEKAVVNAIKHAQPARGIPSYQSIK
ncbi:P1 family peptidase [Lentibacillus saliphilus]|uniref:P1 family peptidase n=1 Tax=Lentibacillus saliphilus TaxID=2737028 RepID=UPI001C2FFE52|nr:P1 family peptidase [Lentibacillus saliphilus]